MKQDLLTQELKDKKQKLEAQERSHQENMAQLKEKFKTERENLLSYLTFLLRNLYTGQEATELDVEQQTGSK